MEPRERRREMVEDRGVLGKMPVQELLITRKAAKKRGPRLTVWRQKRGKPIYPIYSIYLHLHIRAESYSETVGDTNSEIEDL